jgi:hypothetical protein
MQSDSLLARERYIARNLGRKPARCNQSGGASRRSWTGGDAAPRVVSLRDETEPRRRLLCCYGKRLSEGSEQ